MNHSLLSLDSHFLFFDEAEKESFDIDSFLSPVYDIALPVDHDAVLSTPFSSPNKMNVLNDSNGNDSLFGDETLLRPKKSEMKNYIKDLEKRVTELLNENSKLKENVNSLSSDKERLENEISLMQEFMRGVSQENMNLSKDEFNLPVMSSNNLLGLKANHQSSTRVLLLVLLLSFGLLLHQTVTSESIDMTSSNRTVSELNTQASPKIEQKEKNLVHQTQKKVERQNSGVTQKAAKRVLRHEKSTSTRSVKRRKETIKQQNQHQPNPTPIVPLPFPSTISTPPPDPRSVIPDIIQWRPHTTYLICNNVSQIVPPTPIQEQQQRQQSQPSMVSLLIPPDALGTSQENALLEVTCQVMDVNFVPLRL